MEHVIAKILLMLGSKINTPFNVVLKSNFLLDNLLQNGYGFGVRASSERSADDSL